jgi:hypothetical protein
VVNCTHRSIDDAICCGLWVGRRNRLVWWWWSGEKKKIETLTAHVGDDPQEEGGEEDRRGYELHTGILDLGFEVGLIFGEGTG